MHVIFDSQTSWFSACNNERLRCHNKVIYFYSSFFSLYLQEGFLHLENAISLSIIEFYANKSVNLQVSVEVRGGDRVLVLGKFTDDLCG
jgi:hypothetical protein